MSLSSLLPPLRPRPSHAQVVEALGKIQLAVLKSRSSTSDDADDGGDPAIDDWEKRYCMGWLTRLVSAATDAEPVEAWEEVATEAGRCMAFLTSDAGMGSSQPFSRRYSFSGPDGHAFEVEIRDAADMSYSTIGSQTWNAAPLLSRRLCASPASFFPGLFRPAQLAAPAVVVPKFVSPIVGLETPPYTRPSTPLSTPDRFAHPRRAYRILELGSGTGLVGITVAALLSHLLSRGLIDSDVSIELVLTDYHPSVLSNLSHNVASNAHLLASPQLSVSVEALDWRQPETSNVKGTFDVVLGSDLVYEAKHAWLVSYMVKRFLAVPPPPAPAQSLFGAAPAAAFKGVSFPLTPEPSRPTSPSLDRPGPIDGATADSPEQLFHLMLPLRPTFVEESRAVLEAFGGSFSPKPDAAVLPLHDCGWEDTAPVPKVEERPTVTDGRDLRIVGSDRQAGPVIGQGVDTYRYLCITWA